MFAVCLSYITHIIIIIYLFIIIIIIIIIIYYYYLLLLFHRPVHHNLPDQSSPSVAQWTAWCHITQRAIGTMGEPQDNEQMDEEIFWLPRK